MKKHQYCAIIGDIRRSRKLSDRAKVQRRFLKAIDRVNTEFGEALVGAFRLKVAEGDSFEGLLASPVESYRLARRMQELMSGVSISIGIGLGSLATSPSRNVDAVDGEAFHKARLALRRARAGRRGMVFEADSGSAPLVNALAYLAETVRARLTPRQQEVIRLVKALERQEKVARKLGISQPAVSNVMRSPKVRALLEAERVLQEHVGAGFP